LIAASTSCFRNAAITSSWLNDYPEKYLLNLMDLFP